jgi:5-methylcytosine-specific restriction endonuclease McrA
VGARILPISRPTYRNEGWTSRGIMRRRMAEENLKCAFCGKVLPKGRRVYCSDKCSWRFSNDPRYHRTIYLWTRIRAEILWEHKICQICGVNPSSEVDHIREIARGGDPFAKSNLQAVCIQCHRRKTARFLSSRATPKTQIITERISSSLGKRGAMKRGEKPAVVAQRQIEDF